MTLRRAADEMREGWNERARKDAFFYVETEHWDGDVDAFFALGEERAGLLVDPVLRTLATPAAASVALDVGCGVGRLSRAFASRFREVVGVDVSDEMVARATELNPASRYPNLSFESSDGLTLPRETGSVDFVFSYEVFQHMPSHAVILRNLREVRRVLRPAGVALLHLATTPGTSRFSRSAIGRWLPGWLVRALKRHVLRQDPLAADDAFRGAAPLTPARLRALFDEAGLETVELRDDPTHPPGSRTFVLARQRHERRRDSTAA